MPVSKIIKVVGPVSRPWPKVIDVTAKGNNANAHGGKAVTAPANARRVQVVTSGLAEKMRIS
jgi:hypothetical protein